jgi:hypothetical protein
VQRPELTRVVLQGIQLVDGSVRGVVSSTETSFTNIATLMAYGITAGVHDPSQFHILVIIGLVGVTSKPPYRHSCVPVTRRRAASTLCTFLWCRRPGIEKWIEQQEQGSGLAK